MCVLKAGIDEMMLAWAEKVGMYDSPRPMASVRSAVEVEADGVEAGPRERDGQRQAHVAEADDADLRLP